MYKFLIVVFFTLYSCNQGLNPDTSVENKKNFEPSKLIFKFDNKLAKNRQLSPVKHVKTEKGVLKIDGNDPDGDKVPNSGGAGPCIGGGDKNCCYTDADCDDNNPATLNKCITYENGKPKFQCDFPGDPDYCKGTEVDANGNAIPCDDNDPCTLDVCCLKDSNDVPNSKNKDGFALPVCDENLDHRCIHKKIEHCCNENKDCLVDYLNTPGAKGAYLKVHVCCGNSTQTTGYDINGNEVNECLGHDPNTCVHIEGEGYCEDATKCAENQPADKVCLTPYCIAYKCRYGLPVKTLEKNGVTYNCCVKDEDCDDKNTCTIDECKKIDSNDPFPVCVHTQDPQKPNCCKDYTDCCNPDPATCSTDPDLQNDPEKRCCQDGCDKWICVFDAGAQVSYKTCKTIDLKDFGLCCEQDSDCTKTNICVVGACVNNQCRYIKKSEDCCVNSPFECPNDGDQCAKVECTQNKCSLMENPGVCTVYLPYWQKFEMNKTFYNLYSKLSVIAFKVEDTLSDSWEVKYKSGGEYIGPLGPDNFLRFFGNVSGQETCAITPKLNTTGKKVISIYFEYFVDAKATMPGVDIKVKIRNQDDWLTIGTISQIKSTMDKPLFKILETSEKLNSKSTEIGFCVSGDSGGSLNYVGFDNIKIVEGVKPQWTPETKSAVSALTVDKGGKYSFNIVAREYDLSNLKFYLKNAPSWVNISDFSQTKNNFTEGQASLEFDTVACPATGSTVTFDLIADDGYLIDVINVNVSINGCQ